VQRCVVITIVDDDLHQVSITNRELILEGAPQVKT
jgi:hypothetical protein